MDVKFYERIKFHSAFIFRNVPYHSPRSSNGRAIPLRQRFFPNNFVHDVLVTHSRFIPTSAISDCRDKTALSLSRHSAARIPCADALFPRSAALPPKAA